MPCSGCERNQLAAAAKFDRKNRSAAHPKNRYTDRRQEALELLKGRLMTDTITITTREGPELYYAIGECSLGSVLVARSQRGVCAVVLGDDPASVIGELARRFPEAVPVRRDDELNQSLSRVIDLVERPGQTLDLLLDLRGTAFQQRVWQALREIPAGCTSTYTEVAGRIGTPRAVRAVAHACAANHLALVVPCHRVIRRDGSLGGYHWGLERKRILLERETRP
jgi:AraC family transcriptional regulator, regulatory protein of adaptative response / methylated-DNA-[protein]-cysteine methyltransferase